MYCTARLQHPLQHPFKCCPGAVLCERAACVCTPGTACRAAWWPCKDNPEAGLWFTLLSPAHPEQNSRHGGWPHYAGHGPAAVPSRGSGPLRMWPGGLPVSRVSSPHLVRCAPYVTQTSHLVWLGMSLLRAPQQLLYRCSTGTKAWPHVVRRLMLAGHRAGCAYWLLSAFGGQLQAYASDML